MRWPRWLTFPRQPDIEIGGHADPYLRRWYVIPRNRWANVYLHQFCRSDDDRALHDHPWFNISIILRGRYFEHMQDGTVLLRKAGRIVCRPSIAAHRIELLLDQDFSERRVWTLFITGPKVRDWGFWCPQGWRHWEDFTKPGDSTLIGRGCDD